jgi:hypothetical protein
MNITLDITTNSIVFNPLSSQGQWVNHRFGKRKINYQLYINSIIEYISTIYTLEHVTFISIFGDPILHPNIVELCKVLKSENITMTCVTYGMGDNNVFKDLSELGVYFVFKTTGLEDKVFLNTDWQIIKNNIDTVSQKQIQFFKYKHNKNDLNELQSNYDCIVELDGECLCGDCSSIIDEQGNWLYDVHNIDSKSETLVKTLQSYHYLKHFIKSVKGKSILNKPNDFVLPGLNLEFEFEQTNDIFVSASGHVFNNNEEMHIFSNALCDDWSLRSFNLNFEYEKKVYYVIRKLLNRDLNVNRLSSFSY